ncbi:MAG: hypothetical protein LH629_15365 [Ignavibacteria bacterium]|nr:hypothetical protein [Ignavibacteria bacterium]
MIEHIIEPKRKEDLVINLPEKLLNKKLYIRILELKEKYDYNDVEALKFWKSFNFDSEKFKFNRDEANAR